MYLVAMRGFAGSGKSTLARALGRKLGWPVIDKDDVKDVLDGQAPDAGRLAYDALLRVTRRQLLQGLSVICDSPLSFASLYGEARRIAAETGATLIIVECHCPDEAVWRSRISSRQGLGLPSHHQTDWAAFRQYRDARLTEAAYPVTDPHLLVDTTRPVADLVAEVSRWLSQHKSVDAASNAPTGGKV